MCLAAVELKGGGWFWGNPPPPRKRCSFIHIIIRNQNSESGFRIIIRIQNQNPHLHWDSSCSSSGFRIIITFQTRWSLDETEQPTDCVEFSFGPMHYFLGDLTTNASYWLTHSRGPETSEKWQGCEKRYDFYFNKNPKKKNTVHGEKLGEKQLVSLLSNRLARWFVGMFSAVTTLQGVYPPGRREWFEWLSIPGLGGRHPKVFLPVFAGTLLLGNFRETPPF